MKKSILILQTLLSSSTLLLLFNLSVSAQQRKVTGMVTDDKNQPLIGVTVNSPDGKGGTTTNTQGRYAIELDHPEQAVLTFSYVGYTTIQINVADRSDINATLKLLAKGLNEVVVVGYGTEKKVNLTGAVASVDNKALENRPATNVTSLLQGKMPGVNVTQTSGQPGREGTSMLIRGLGTMNNAQPLVIIDGVEGSLDDVNPSDIATVSVLKDAASAAIYGSRSANGVILITTKRGQTGTSVITYRAYVGKQKAIGFPHSLSSADYTKLYNEGLKNEGLPPSYTEEDIRKYQSGEDPYNYPNTDWLELLLQGSGFTQNHDLTFSGGTEKSQYMVSLGYNEQAGLTKNTAQKRYNVRINLDSKITKWFKLGVNAGLSRRNITSPTSPYGDFTQFFRQANRIPPTFINKYEDGSWGRHIDGNPIAWVETGGLAESKYSHLLGSTFGEITVMKDLTLTGIAGIDYSIDDGKTHIKTITYGDGSVQGPNSVSDYLGRNENITLQALLNYKKSFHNHAFKFLLGASRQSYLSDLDQGYRKNFPSDILAQLDAGSSEGWTNSGNATESRLGSYFGRINYVYEDKYLFEANLRSDGSSRFASNNRWGTFPSFSAGWRLSEENFFKQITWINSLKLRGSWGKLGNDRITDYQYLSTISLGQNYDFGDAIADGAATTAANNPDITWETTTESNIGIDATILHNLLSITIDYYNRYTTDILTSVPVSLVFGLPAPTVNAGAMRNKGIEFQLEHNHDIGSLHYNISLNGAYNKNVVVKFKNPSKGDQVYMEGVSWGSFYGYQVTGIFQTDHEATASPHPVGSPVKAGDLEFRDQNGDGKIDGNDRIVLGNTIPEITYGFNVNLEYKNMDLSLFFQGADQVYRILNGETEWPFNNGGKALEMHLDRTIVEDGKVVKQGYYPRTLINQTQNRVMSSFEVLNSAYLRMKNLQIGYTFPGSWMNKVHISKARIYLSGENLLTFTKFPKVADPEVASGNSNYSYPQVQFYTVGLNITF